ncbi:MAG: 2Fe-2S iron-sulfur cluster-binding protein [Gemmataceae bacterium]|nr:2Fe-2S iron-sulfur cluster-binding protein [Gemmataceae bacterium]
MATVFINDRPIDIGADRLNLIQAAARAGVPIPHYCWHPALSVVASCRMCLVEVGEKKADGTVAMQPRVVPACQTPAKDGTVVLTNSPKARQAQQQTLEGLLLNHPLDCPVCDKAGECLLQDFSFRYGRATSRMIDDKNHPPNKDYIGEHITLFADRCIMCSRCVRFTREISGTAELQVIHRGHHCEIDIFPGEPLNNKLAGNVVDLCPVGALCSKDFLYKQRVWFLKTQPSVCPGCSTGCSIFIDANKDIVYRLRPRENPQAQGWFMCDEGRFDYAYVNDGQRWGEPRFEGQPTEWSKLLPALRNDLAAAAKERPQAVAAVLSPMLTCEEAYLLAKFIKGLAPTTRLYLGWVPRRGDDEHFPQDRRGRPVPPILFTIRAEKVPNRRGVEEVLRHFAAEVLGFDALVAAAAAGEIQAVYLTGGYSPRLGPWLSDEQLAALQKIPLRIVQDLFPSALMASARYALPAATFAEKEGCFVNHANLAQALHRSVAPARSVRSEGQVFLELLQRRGLFHAASLRQEMAREVPFFAKLGAGDLGEHGVRLG